MDNYHLYSTNVFLSGQVKWDLVLESEEGLFVRDLHITPVSPNVHYVYTDHNTLNYSHQQNIKMLYDSIKDEFYDNCIPEALKTGWPMLYESNVKPHDDSYIAGVSRSSRYSLYGKQFECFCPLWIEKANPGLYFDFIIETLEGKEVLSKRLVLDKSLPENDIYANHHKTEDYIYNYMSDVGLLKGNDDVVNINFLTNTATISGLNVISGLPNVMNIDDMCYNLLYRERPVMESDMMIIRPFQDYHMICRQLFNINLCFNIEDLAGPKIASMLYGKQFRIRVEVGDSEGPFDRRDFYTNYDNISKDKFEYTDLGKYTGVFSDKSNKEDINVYNYLQDNKCLSLIDKNKFSPCITHWAIVGNPDYLFNVYDGFSGCADKDDKTVVCNGLNGLMPDIYHDIYYPEFNNINWANIVRITSIDELYSIYDNMIDIIRNDMSDFNQTWVNGLQYGSPKDLKVMLIYIDEDDSDIYNKASLSSISINKSLLAYEPPYIGSNAIILMSNKLDSLTFLSVRRSIQSYSSSGLISSLRDVMDSVNPPRKIHIDKSLYTKPVNGPSDDTEEIEYYKNDNNDTYIYRYDGRLRPMFIEVSGNLFYYKDMYHTINDIDPVFRDPVNTQYTPLYKSIGYCGIKSIPLTYDTVPLKEIGSPKECTWYDHSEFFFLLPTIDMNLIAEPGKEAVTKAVKEELRRIYSLEDESDIDYIYKCYNIYIDFEYAEITDISKYNYSVKLSLA